MARYWASCSPGLQFALIAELQKLEHTDIMCDSLILGGVVFSTFSAPTEVLKLRSADNVYAFVGKFQGLPFERDAAVSYLKELTGLADWELPLDLFWKWKSHTLEISPEKGKSLDSTAMVKDNKVDSKSISFRVSCDRACVTMKKHGFTSMEAAAALGEGVCKRFGWPANMRSYDLEVLAWIRDDEVVLALALLYRKLNRGLVHGKIEEEHFKIEVHDKSFSSCSGEISKTDDFAQQDKSLGKTLKRSPRASCADSQLYARRRYRKALVITSLKPSVAHALLQLGCILPGNVILDPMCGSGTIPLEAIDWLGNQVFCMAGDIATQAVDATFENVNASGDVLQCDVLRWDASNLPLRKGVVDRIVCDMPFGVRCGTSRSRESLCPKVLKEVVRVLQLGTGVAILLGQSKAVRHEVETKQKPFLNLLQNLPIQMEGLRVQILVVQRTMEPYYA